MNFQQAHLIATIQTLFSHDEQLGYFFFSHKQPELRLSPRELMREARCLSRGENILIRAAMDFWLECGDFRLHEALSGLDDENILALVRAILYWREIDVRSLLNEDAC